jgi:hypothetical protein
MIDALWAWAAHWLIYLSSRPPAGRGEKGTVVASGGEIFTRSDRLCMGRRPETLFYSPSSSNLPSIELLQNR